MAEDHPFLWLLAHGEVEVNIDHLRDLAVGDVASVVVLDHDLLVEIVDRYVDDDGAWLGLRSVVDLAASPRQ